MNKKIIIGLLAVILLITIAVFSGQSSKKETRADAVKKHIETTVHDDEAVKKEVKRMAPKPVDPKSLIRNDIE